MIYINKNTEEKDKNKHIQCFTIGLLLNQQHSNTTWIQVRSIFVPAVISCTYMHAHTYEWNAMSRNVCEHTFTTPSLTSFYHFILLHTSLYCSNMYAFRASSCHKYTNSVCKRTRQWGNGYYLLYRFLHAASSSTSS